MRLHIWTDPRGGKTLTKVLLVGLAALLVASLSATLGGSAQTNSDKIQGGAIEGRVIGRVQDRTGTDGVDHYRIEFGFLPQWAIDEHDPWSEAVTTFSELLPRARYLTKATIDARRDADNRRWLRSSPISVPAPSAGGDALSGRVIARYNPHPLTGALRIEFGFLPEGAFTSTADTQEAVAQYGERFLPRARYLTASLIENRRGAWLHSSLITVTRLGTEPAPVIDSISCSPSPPTVGEEVVCTASLSGGAPDTHAWTGGVAPGGEADYSTTFDTSGRKTVSLTVSNSEGSDSESIAVTVNTPPEATGRIADVTLDVDGSERVDVGASFRDDDGDSLTYGVDSDGGAVGWSVSGSAVTLEGISAGSAMVTVTATDPHGASAEQSFRVTVGSGPPVIDSLNCTPWEPQPEQAVTCTAQLSGGEPDRWDWSDSNGGSAGCDNQVGECVLTDCDDQECWLAVTSIADSSESYSTTFSQAGRQTISLTVSNSEGSDSESIAVTVNTPPEATGRIADVTLDVDGSERVDVGASFRDDDGDSLTYGVDSDGGAVGWSVSGSSVTLEGVSAGSATVTVTATDPHGASAEQTFRVTVNGPLGIACSPPSPTVNQSVICTASLSGGTATSYSWGGGASRGSDPIYRTTFRSAGDHTISVTVRDSAGQERQSSLTITVNTPPEAVGRIADVTLDVDDSERIDVGPRFRDADGDRLTYEADSDNNAVEVGVSGTTVTVTGVREGSATITVTADDGVGGTAMQTFRVTVEGGLPPSCVVRNASGNSLIETVNLNRRVAQGSFNAFFRVTVVCTDPDGDDDQLRLSWRSGDSDIALVRGLGSTRTTIRSGETSGSTTVTFTATDTDGLSGSVDVSVVVDKVPPQITSISCTPSSPTVGQSVTCMATVAGSKPTEAEWSIGSSTSSGQIETDLSNSSPYSTDFTTSFSSEGGYAVSLSVSNDTDGSDSESTSVTVGSEPVAPPVIDRISCSPSPVATNMSVTCTVSLSDSGGTATTYSWSGGDVSGSISSSSYLPSWSSAGSKTVLLTVGNGGGSDSDSTTVTVVAAPVINSISCTPSSPTVNDTVTCTASLSGGAPDSYSWSGGASAGSGSTYSTSFSTSGSQMVSLTVSNGGGSDSGSASVTVEEVNQAPECRSISGLSPIILGKSRSVRFRCSDPDGSPELIVVTVASDDSNIVEARLDHGVSVEISGALRSTRLRMEGTGEGSTTIRATATDAKGASTTITFSVTVGENLPPQCDSASDITLEVGENDTVSLTCDDPNGFTLGDGDFVARSSNAAVATTVVTVGSITERTVANVKVTAVRAGTATITVTATDGHGGSTDVLFGVTVSATSGTDPPTN